MHSQEFVMPPPSRWASGALDTTVIRYRKMTRPPAPGSAGKKNWDKYICNNIGSVFTYQRQVFMHKVAYEAVLKLTNSSFTVQL